MYTITLPLITTKYDEQVIGRRFKMMQHVHNVLVSYAIKCLNHLKQDLEYQKYCEQLRLLNKDDEKDKAKYKIICKQLTVIRKRYKVTKNDFEKYIKVCGKQFNKHLSSQQIQKEANHVWQAVETILFASGENISYKSLYDMRTISGKSNLNGIRFNSDDCSINWNGLHINCKKKYFSTDKISYCEIKRLMFPNGWHYYVIIYYKGNSPFKKSYKGGDIAGVDCGTSTVAVVGSNQALLTELATDCKKYNHKIANLQQAQDKSRRISNPDRYNPDGTVKKIKGKWIESKSYKKRRKKIQSLQRQKSAYTKTQHGALCNQLLNQYGGFITETMDFAALMKKDKADKDKPTKKRKRFGKSINDRSPSLFVRKLQEKCESNGFPFNKVDTCQFRASQYNHITDTYIKHKLSERFLNIGEYKIQRDLYSAFLLMNSNEEMTHTNRNSCLKTFDNFVAVHETTITEMKLQGKSMKTCFGF